MLQRRSRGDHLSHENRIGDQSCAAMHAEATKRGVAASRPSIQQHDLERGGLLTGSEGVCTRHKCERSPPTLLWGCE